MFRKRKALYTVALTRAEKQLMMQAMLRFRNRLLAMRGLSFSLPNVRIYKGTTWPYFNFLIKILSRRKKIPGNALFISISGDHAIIQLDSASLHLAVCCRQALHCISNLPAAQAIRQIKRSSCSSKLGDCFFSSVYAASCILLISFQVLLVITHTQYTLPGSTYP